MISLEQEADNIFKGQKPIENSGRLHWVHWLIIAASLVVTFIAWYLTDQQIQEKHARQFEKQVSRVIALVNERMHKYEDTLWAGVAAIKSQSHGIDYFEWKRFSKALRIEERYQGINGIGVIYYIKPENLEEYLRSEREIRPDYKIHPPHDKKEFLPITYIEPVESNAEAVGLDMAHEANRYQAALDSRDSGKAKITAPITLVQDSEKTPGFLFYAPFYKGASETLEERQESFLGLVYAPFIVKKLMRGTLLEANRDVAIKITVGDTEVYNENKVLEKDIDSAPMFRKKVDLDLYGKKWIFELESTKSFRKNHSDNQSMVILIGGITIDSFLLMFFIVLTRSNKRAIALARKMSEGYRHKAVEVEASEKFLSAILDTVLDGIVTIDERGVIKSVNPALVEMLGYSEDELIGQNIKLLMPERFKNAHQAGMERFIKTGDKKVIGQKAIEFESKKKNGEIFPIEISIGEAKTEGGRIFVGSMRDITERQKLMEKILDSNEELQRFAYICSHDMQEPLRMINIFSQRFESHMAGKIASDEKAKKYLGFITDGAKNAQRLISDILEYSRIDNESERQETINLNKLLDDILVNFQRIIEEESKKITHDELPNIFGNKTQIYQLFQNLINNGLKYQKPDSTAHVHVSYEDIGSHYKFSVKDNGIGMEKRHLTKIFEVFKRLHGRDEYVGTGIGLSLCKKIVERHGGKIWVESKVGEGSTFYFTIIKG